MDFGLAVPADYGHVHVTAVGTPAYMAPEQFVGAGVTEQTDIYALRLVLYELFLGRGVFVARTLEERAKPPSPQADRYSRRLMARRPQGPD